jgi:hypothetical protein
MRRERSGRVSLTCGIVAAVARLNSADDVDIIGEVGVRGQGKRGGEGKLLPLLGLHSSMPASRTRRETFLRAVMLRYELPLPARLLCVALHMPLLVCVYRRVFTYLETVLTARGRPCLFCYRKHGYGAVSVRLLRVFFMPCPMSLCLSGVVIRSTTGPGWDGMS